MESIKAKILFTDNNKSSVGASIGMMLVIGFFIFLLFFGLWFGPEPNIISIVNYILLIIILGYVAHINQSQASDKTKLKNVTFEYESKDQIVRISVQGSDFARTLNDFKIKAEIQSRVSSCESGLFRKNFFNLQIIPAKGKSINLFEEIDKNSDISNIKINPETQHSFSVLISIDPFPGPIFKLYNVLKENHLKE